jgi:hypothetical protein
MDGPAMPVTYGGGHGMLPHVTFGKPGALSWKPFSHIAQLSVAKDHSPTSTGNVLACGEHVEGD